MSALVRLRPVPPALREMRKMGILPFWNWSTGVCLSFVFPVILTNGMLFLMRCSSMILSMDVNCEKMRMLLFSLMNVVSSCVR